jgi:hypothetical protein
MTTPSDGAADDRRHNRLLRLLIDEMLEQVREVNRHASNWSPEERAQAEEALERIMSQVRGTATKRTSVT